MIRTAAPATLYVCGGAANELELADRFTQMFLLGMDEPTMLARLDAPGRDNEWGRIGDTREHLRRRLPGHQDRLRASGAIPIDARQPLDQVVDAILSYTFGQLRHEPSQPAASRPPRWLALTSDEACVDLAVAAGHRAARSAPNAG